MHEAHGFAIEFLDAQDAVTMLIDEELSLRSLDGNKDLLIQLAQIFTEDAPVLLQNLQGALEQQDAAGARLAAHSLKGLVSTFYAKSSAEFAHQVEQFCAAGDLENARGSCYASLVESVQNLIEEIKRRQWSE